MGQNLGKFSNRARMRIYKGEGLPKKLASFIQCQGGNVTLEDLKNMKSQMEVSHYFEFIGPEN